jgi:RNA polymerase sigma factor (sigma-70 family)
MLFRLEVGTRPHPEVGVDDVYQELKPLMFSIAYRMLGSATEAEDIVQEAFLRFHKETTDGNEVTSAKAYLSAVTTRLSIDYLRSARPNPQVANRSGVGS